MKKTPILLLSILATFAIASGSSNLIVPAYFYPSQGDPNWTALYKTTRNFVKIFLISNSNIGFKVRDCKRELRTWNYC